MIKFNFLRTAGLAAVALASVMAMSTPSFAWCPWCSGEDLGQRDTKIDAGDTATSREATSVSTPRDGSPVAVNETVHYEHTRFLKGTQTYTVTYSGSADYVDRLGYWVFKDPDSGFIRFSQGSSTGTELKEKPRADIGTRTSQISSDDRAGDAELSAGATSFDGQTRAINVTRRYTHADNLYDQTYTVTTTETAHFVDEQHAYMLWVGDTLYKARVGSTNVERLWGRPTVNAGEKFWKVDFNDQLQSVDVIPDSLTSDHHSVEVLVRHNYRHDETYQVKQYYTESREVARYDETYRVWTVRVDGRIYAITFDGDKVSDDSGVVVVKAPDSMRRPDVIVVAPNGEDPPVVVPGKKTTPTTDDDPPVVVPGKKKPPVVKHTDDDPPVVVPAKKKPPVVVHDDDDDGPAVVVPRR